MSYAFETFAVQQEVEKQRVRVVVKVSDSVSPIQKTILDQSFSAFMAIFIVPLVAILVAVLMIVLMVQKAGFFVLNILKNVGYPLKQPNYEEAKKWFEEGNGYLANLSEEEKKKLRVKKDFPF